MYKKYFILFFMLLFFVKPVFADSYPAVLGFSFNNTNHSSLSSVCTAYSDHMNVANPAGSGGFLGFYGPQILLSSSANTCNYTVTGANGGNTESSNLYNGIQVESKVFSSVLYCPNSGDLSGSECINVPPCVAPQIRDSSGICAAPPAPCPGGQYHDTSTSCVSIPNCQVTGGIPYFDGNYFDVATKQCVNSNATNQSCISKDASGVPISRSTTGNFYCPPVNDCKPASYICSNDTVEVAIVKDQQASDLAFSKSLAADNLTNTALAADQASNSAADLKVTAESLRAAITTAGAALNDPLLTDAQRAVAKQNFQKALTDYSNASNAAANAAAAAAGASAQVAWSQDASDVINNPLSLPYAVRAASGQSDGALAGAGEQSGAASTGTSLEPSTDTKGLATDATLNSLKSDVEKLGSSESSGSYDSLPSTFYETKYPGGLSGVWSTKKAAFEQTSFKQSIKLLMPQLANAGSCPSWEIPGILNFPAQTLTMPCQIWPVLRVFLMITTLFYSRKIIFGG